MMPAVLTKCVSCKHQGDWHFTSRVTHLCHQCTHNLYVIKSEEEVKETIPAGCIG